MNIKEIEQILSNLSTKKVQQVTIKLLNSIGFPSDNFHSPKATREILIETIYNVLAMPELPRHLLLAATFDDFNVVEAETFDILEASRKEQELEQELEQSLSLLDDSQLGGKVTKLS